MKASPRPLRRTGRGVALPLLVFLGLAAPAGAQVTLNLNALDALPETASPPPGHAHRRIEGRPAHGTAKARKHAPAVAAAKPAAKTAPPAVATQLPTVPAMPPPAPPPSVANVAPPAAPAPATAAPAPPVVASTAPVPVPPAAEAQPPAPPQVAVAPAPSPDRKLHVGFASGQSDLNSADTGAIAAFAHATPRGDTTSFEVAAHAPAPDGDASTARRLSLARALAIRGALVSAGVPAASIYVRALGAPPANQGGNADSAVVTVMGVNGAESKQASQK